MPAIAIIGAQWGDEGKGKVAHVLAKDADWVVRFNGGANAGHTVVFGEPPVTLKLHHLPSGVAYRHVTSVLGQGMVVDIAALAEELTAAEQALGYTPRWLLSRQAHLILPYHRLIERLGGTQKTLGTTARGIGPAYQDKAARQGLRVGDLLRPQAFRERLAQRLEALRRLCPQAPELAAWNADDLAAPLLAWADRWQERLVDPRPLLWQALDAGETVIFEGAQATLLDLDHGTYPYVTSSNPTVGGIGTGAGVPPQRLDEVIGVTKAYTTRVGRGPFPTELTDDQGEALRQAGAEFGTTTGRPRRCGWLDLVALRYAAQINGFTSLVITKLDVLTGFDSLPVAVAYRCGGRVVETFPSEIETLAECEPVYETLPGWQRDLREVRRLRDLPPEARGYLQFIEEHVGVPVAWASVGPGFDDVAR